MTSRPSSWASQLLGTPPNPGGEEGMGTKQLGAATQAVPSPPAPTLLGLDR